jgi:hypothetical protein
MIKTNICDSCGHCEGYNITEVNNTRFAILHAMIVVYYVDE